MLPIVATLLSSGLSLIGNAVVAKGKDWVEKKTGVSLDQPMTPEVLAALKQAELEHEAELQALRVEELKIHAADTASARQREVDVVTSENAPLLNKIIVPILALIVVVAGMAMVAWGETSEVKMSGNSLATLVLGYYFGSSLGSKNKAAELEKRK